MRYSFHGKVRANGQQVDGFVEAANATEAIDRLADRGIIGVYSVRPEPKPVKNAVRLSGEAEPPEDSAQRQQERRQLPAPSNNSRLQKAPAVVPKRIGPAPLQKTAAPTAAAAAVPAADATPAPAAGTEAVLLQLIDKLTVLMSRVENALSRPMNVMYQAGPVRSSGFTATKKSGRIPQDVQTNTLHDIFQNNLDLRKSLDKLASTVGTPAGKPAEKVAEQAAIGGSAGQQVASVQPQSAAAVYGAAPVREPQSVREPARETPKPVREANARDSAGRDSAGRDSAGRDSAGRDSAGRDSAGRESAGHGQKLAPQPQPV